MDEFLKRHQGEKQPKNERRETYDPNPETRKISYLDLVYLVSSPKP